MYETWGPLPVVTAIGGWHSFPRHQSLTSRHVQTGAVLSLNAGCPVLAQDTRPRAIAAWLTAPLAVLRQNSESFFQVPVRKRANYGRVL